MSGKNIKLSDEDRNDPLVKYMIKNDIPLTREKYIALAYGSDGPGEEWGAELEAELPKIFQNKD